MIVPISTKLELPGYTAPRWSVEDKIFYSKFHAVQQCEAVGWEWPSFNVWSEPGTFARPKLDFSQASSKQCEIISDSYSKVRLFYSGGRESHFMLCEMLRNKSKLDEIAIYRRFPGVVDAETNEFDQFNIMDVLVKTLAEHDRKVPIKFYDLMPEHFNYYSSRLDQLYFAYTNLEFFAHGVHTVAECFPEILEDDFVNLLGHAIPHVTDNKFYWIDMQFNMANPDPYALHFFVDHRNPDLAVNLAYAVHDANNKVSNWGSGKQKSFLPIKNKLNFDITGTKLDNKWGGVDVSTNCYRWWMGKKDIVYHANALKSDVGIQTMANMINFYEQCEKKYSKYFEQGCIYNTWVGGVSEKHTLTDI